MNNNELKKVEKIKNYYVEKEVTKYDELKNLDKKVRKGANIFSYIFGVIGSLVLGFGMCIAMEVILEGNMVIGIIIGLVGILMVCVNYTLYKKIVNKNKNKYREQIIDLSNELLNEEGK